MGDDDAAYWIVWEFLVTPAAVAEFRRAYGPQGAWVTLFRRGDGHLETLLLEDRSRAGRFVTVDRWRSAAAHDAFRSLFAADYDALDAACAPWCEGERLIGEFTSGTATRQP